MRSAVGFLSLLGLLGSLNACSSALAAEGDDSSESAIDGAAPASSSKGKSGAHTPVSGEAPLVVPDPGIVSLPTPSTIGTGELCHLVNGRNVDDPAPNNLHFRTNLKGTDLGIPVQHDDKVYFFFGDSVGYKGIWQFGESQPDAVGFADAADLARDPRTLCTQMDFLHVAGNAVGPARDARIQTDWAGVSMTAPAGHTLGEFIHNPAGHGKYPNLPGDFEVPSGAFSANGSIYVFYTTVDAQVHMKGSYLAKWRQPDPNGQPNLDILYHVDQRFDASGEMRGDFINNATLVDGGYVYVYGTGEYRASPIQLARKKLSSLETAGGFERFDAATKTWRGPQEATKPIVDVPAIGELSVRFYPEIGRYMMIAEESAPTRNQIVARFAAAPEGPWSDGVLVADMGNGDWRAKYCCAGDACNGEQLFHCDRAGFYGTYLLPTAQKNNDGTFTTTFLMSTWDPYNVALMQATFR